MKKTNKENPLTFFRKANEARQKVVKNSLTKAQNGIVVNSRDVMSNPSDAKYYSMEPNPRSNVDTVNKSILDKTKSTSSAPNNPRMDYLDKQAIAQQARDKYSNAQQSAMSKEMYKAKMDAMTNRPKSNTPMMDSMFQKKGGSVKRKK
jgi:hypothetical protein